MSIDDIQLKLSSSDILTINKILSGETTNSEDFEQIISDIKERAEQFESKYKPEKDIFPEHNFKKIVFQKLLTDFQDEQSSNNPVTSQISGNTNNLVDNITSSTTSDNDTYTSTNSVLETNISPTTVSYTSEVENNKEVSGSSQVAATSVRNISGYTQYDNIISEMATKYSVPFNLIKSVINAESTFNPNATSKTGAMGLMQLMPDTAKWLGVLNAYDPKQNIEGGTKYLGYLLNRFNGDMKLAVAGYNAGAGNVEKYKGIPPFTETLNYVKKILG